jgi:hypothetical protein
VKYSVTQRAGEASYHRGVPILTEAANMKILAACAFALLATACATNDPAADGAAERRYTTGSNLPLRDRNVKVMTAEELEQMKNSSAANTGRPRAQ